MNQRLNLMNSSIPAALLLLAVFLPLSVSARDDASSISIQSFPEVSAVSPRIRKMIGQAVDLAKRDLDYVYGEADPERGFDCSGMMYYLLLQMGAPNVPRQANTLHEYLCEKDAFHPARKPDQLGELEPGDLLFWTGTYDIDRKVTHVMMYLGLDKKTGQRWMVGAASRDYGVGVFPFNPGSAHGIGRNFIGFGKVAAFFGTGKLGPSKAPPVVIAALSPKSTPKKVPAASNEYPPRAVNTFFEGRPSLPMPQ